MTKSMFEVQQTIKNLKQQINDVLHLASLNNQSIMCLTQNSTSSHQTTTKKAKPSKQNEDSVQIYQTTNLSKPNENTLLKKHLNIQQKFNNISTFFEKRSENHLNYLIVKQIQGQQESVRRDRLNQYEQKIYDQRRLISDKEVFLESLYRPKKQRPESMSSEQFQELRSKQRAEEERFKLSTLDEEIKSLTLFKKRMDQADAKNTTKRALDSVIIKKQIQLYNKMKSQDLQKTKSSSIEVINLSAFSNLQIDKLQKIVEQAELNTIINQNTQQESNKEIQDQQEKENTKTKSQTIGSVSQKNFDKQNNNNACYTIQIQKLIQTYEKSSIPEDAKQKFLKIKSILRKIQLKKQQNSTKNKQLMQLKKENTHMSAHLKKIKVCYLANQGKIRKDAINQQK